KFDKQGSLEGNLIERIQSLHLGGAERDVGLVVADLDPVAKVTAQKLATIPGEHGNLEGGGLTGAHTAAAIDVEWLVEERQYAAMLRQQPVVHGTGADHLAQAAHLGRL